MARRYQTSPREAADFCLLRFSDTHLHKARPAASDALLIIDRLVRFRSHTCAPFQIAGSKPQGVFENTVKLRVTSESCCQRGLRQVAPPPLPVELKEAFDA